MVSEAAAASGKRFMQPVPWLPLGAAWISPFAVYQAWDNFLLGHLRQQTYLLLCILDWTYFLVPSLKPLGVHSNHKKGEDLCLCRGKWKQFGTFETFSLNVYLHFLNGHDYFVLIQLITFPIRITEDHCIGLSLNVNCLMNFEFLWCYLIVSSSCNLLIAKFQIIIFEAKLQKYLSTLQKVMEISKAVSLCQNSDG